MRGYLRKWCTASTFFQNRVITGFQTKRFFFKNRSLANMQKRLGISLVAKNQILRDLLQDPEC